VQNYGHCPIQASVWALCGKPCTPVCIAFKQVLKVIREQRVAPRRIKRIANYRFHTAALECWRRCRWRPDLGRSLRVSSYVFADEFRVNPHFDLEFDYIIRKGIWRRIQRYTVRTEILPIFQTRVDNRSTCHFCILFTPKLPLPLRRSAPKSSTLLPSQTPLTTPNGTKIHPRVWPLLTCADRQMVHAKRL